MYTWNSYLATYFYKAPGSNIIIATQWKQVCKHTYVPTKLPKLAIAM